MITRQKIHCCQNVPHRRVSGGSGLWGTFPVSQQLRVQTVDATSSFNASNGDTQLRVLRGRSLSSLSIAVSSR
jgi:hypothetical protein